MIRVYPVGSPFPVDRRTWDFLSTGTTVYSSWDHMHFADNFSRGTGFVTTEIDGRVIGVLPFYKIGDRTVPLYRMDVEYQDCFTAVGSSHGIVAGSCTAYRSDILVSRSLSPERRGAVAAEMFTTLAHAATAGDLGPELAQAGWLSMPYLTWTDAQLMHPHLGGASSHSSVAHADDRFLLSRRVATCELPVPGDGFEELVAGLPKRRRAQIRREWEAAHKLDRVWSESDYRDVEVLARLLGAVELKHSQARPLEHYRDVVAGYRRHMASRSLNFYVSDCLGSLTAFATLFEDVDTLYARSYGAIAELATTGIYFALHIYLPLAYALANGISRLDLGPATSAKYHRGAEVSLLWNYVQVVNGGRLLDPYAVAEKNSKTLQQWRGQYSRISERRC